MSYCIANPQFASGVRTNTNVGTSNTALRIGNDMPQNPEICKSNDIDGPRNMRSIKEGARKTKLQDLVHDHFHTIKQSPRVRESSMKHIVSLELKFYTYNWSHRECLSDDPSIPNYEVWLRAPKRWIYNAMSNAKQVIEEEGLPIHIMSNADGMEEPRAFGESDLEQPMTKREDTEQFCRRAWWIASI